MKNKVYIIFLLVSVVSFGQRKYAADKYFKDLAYVKSAKLYEDIYKRGDTSKQVLNRLADSYYFNNKMKNAEEWYAKLFGLYAKYSINSESYFRYAQTLKSNGNYKESDKWLLKFRELNNQDSRGQKLIEQRNYFDELSKDKNHYRSIHNLSINTKYSDYGGFIKGDTVYFSSTRPKAFNSTERKYHWNQQPYYNIYKAKEVKFDNEKNINFIDLEGVKKLANVNTKYHDANAVITKDGKTMYFNKDNGFKNRRKNKGNLIRLKLFKAEKLNGEWTNITELPFNSNEYSVGHPALSPDEKTLYFVSNKPGGFGKEDIYEVGIKSDGTFGEPKNLGKEINSEGVEMFPYMSKDSTLFFSSNGHIGLGGLDIFESKLNKDNSFNGIANLGKPINSKKDDFYFIVNKEKKTGYFTSNREGGKGDDDIYSFVLKEKEKPCNVKIVGQVKDAVTNQILPRSSVTLYDENNVKVDSLIVGDDAKFEFILPCNQNYTLIGSKRYYKPSDQAFFTKASTGVLTTKKMDLRLNDDFRYSDKLEMIINIKPIYFDTNKSKIRPDAAIQLDKVIAVMKKYPEIEIRSSSHTDAIGRASYNEKLSDRRAKSTVAYIISNGINPSRITGKGYGETQLTNGCKDGVKCTPEEHQLNRRTEFVIVKKAE